MAMETELGPADREQGAGVELARLLGILRRAVFNWQPSALIIAIGLIAGVSFAVLRKPTYRSETIVIYRQGVRLNEERGGVSLTLGARLEEMLKARGRLEGLIQELSLYEKMVREKGVSDAIEELRKDIQFKARSTDTFSISFRGPDPEAAQRVTARLAQTLIEENQRLRVEQAKVQTEFLAAEKNRAESELKIKEQQLAQFLSEHPEFALDQNASASGVAVRAREREAAKDGLRDSSLDALRRQSLRLDAAISGETSVYPTSDAAADPELEAARAQAESALASARADLNAKKNTLTDQHPDVIAAKGRVADAEKALRSAEEKVAASRLSNTAKSGSKMDPEAAKQKLRDNKRKIDAEIAAREKAAKGEKEVAQPAPTEEATSIVGLETSWARLSRDVSEARDQMNELERNYFRAQIEASSSLGGYSDQVVVLDPAFLPTRPEPPGKSLIVLIAGGLSFALAMVVALLRALLDRRIYEEADLARIAPILAVVPRSGRRHLWRR
ncbi:MAG: protein kinase [Myxococcales bacterium]|nr:protein kinase [Myxococcales bacterium]